MPTAPPMPTDAPGVVEEPASIDTAPAPIDGGCEPVYSELCIPMGPADRAPRTPASAARARMWLPTRRAASSSSASPSADVMGSGEEGGSHHGRGEGTGSTTLRSRRRQPVGDRRHHLERAGRLAEPVSGPPDRNGSPPRLVPGRPPHTPPAARPPARPPQTCPPLRTRRPRFASDTMAATLRRGEADALCPDRALSLRLWGRRVGDMADAGPRRKPPTRQHRAAP